MLQIDPIYAFDDNYIWLLYRPGINTVVVIDPGDEAPVINALTKRGLTLGAILLTHRHGDHTGGVKELTRRFPVPVYGPAREKIIGVNHPVEDNAIITLPKLDLTLQVLQVPGHTEGHIAFFGEGRLFCGDTLFSAGCGRVFTKDYLAMASSLKRLAALPSETLVYCAHEYTLANLGFAVWVEPRNLVVASHRAQVDALRATDHPTLPSTIGLEREMNPFLRTAHPEVIAAAERWAGRTLNDHAEVFRALREWKDRDYD